MRPVGPVDREVGDSGGSVVGYEVRRVIDIGELDVVGVPLRITADAWRSATDCCCTGSPSTPIWTSGPPSNAPCALSQSLRPTRTLRPSRPERHLVRSEGAPTPKYSRTPTRPSGDLSERTYGPVEVPRLERSRGRDQRGRVPRDCGARGPPGRTEREPDPRGRIVRHRHRSAAVQRVRDRDLRRVRQDRAPGVGSASRWSIASAIAGVLQFVRPPLGVVALGIAGRAVDRRDRHAGQRDAALVPASRAGHGRRDRSCSSCSAGA